MNYVERRAISWPEISKRDDHERNRLWRIMMFHVRLSSSGRYHVDAASTMRHRCLLQCLIHHALLLICRIKMLRHRCARTGVRDAIIRLADRLHFRELAQYMACIGCAIRRCSVSFDDMISDLIGFYPLI